MSTNPVTNNNSWYYGRTIDLVFGCGLIYVFAFPLLLAIPGPDSLIAITVLATFIAGPHYGATYLRVVESDASRRRYGKIALALTVIVGAAFFVGLHSVSVGSGMAMLYLTWSPWHFSGQNYGLALMFLRRRGVTVTPLAKRVLYASFWLSFAPAVLILHSGANLDYAPVQKSIFSVYPIVPWGIPRDVAMLLIPTFVAAYFGTLCWAGVLLLRGGSLAAIAPSMLIVALQSMWFVVPGFLFSLGFDFYSTMACVPLTQSAVHSIQYLWVSSYYVKREDPTARLVPFFAKATLAGAAGFGALAIFFSPGLLGNVPYDSGLALLTASAINLHHFALDGIIWKLRDGPVSRALLGTGATSGPAIMPPLIWRRWLRPAVFTLGAASILISGVYVWEVRALNAADDSRIEVGLTRLSWIGRDSAMARQVLASRLVNRGQHRRALEEIDRSLRLLPNSAAWMVKGQLHEKDRYWSAALEAYDAVLKMDPTNFVAEQRRRAVAAKIVR